jgi:hypothetical protein
LTPLFLHLYSAPCSVESNLVPRLFPLRASLRVVERAWVRGCVESWHCAIGILGMHFWCLLYNIYYQIFEIPASQLPNFPVGSSTYARIKIVYN